MKATRGLIGSTAFLCAALTAAEPVFISPNLNGEISLGHNIELDMTPDGRFVLFEAEADDMVAGDSNGYKDLILLDRLSNTTELISVGATFGPWSPAEIHYEGRLSADGRFVVFTTAAGDLAPGVPPSNSTNVPQIYVRDRMLGETEIVSVNDAGEPLEDISLGARISDDGRYVAFMADAPSISEGQAGARIYQVDRATGERVIVSRDRGGSHPSSTGTSAIPSMSGDGRWITFGTVPLLPEVPTDQGHIYLWDRTDDSLEVISRTPAGELGDGFSDLAVISRDGNFVVFTSGAPNLTGQPVNETHTMRVELATGLLEPVDIDEQGQQQRPDAEDLTIRAMGFHVSGDGRYIAFPARKSLIPGVSPNSPFGVYVRDMERTRSVVAAVNLQGGRQMSVGPVTDDGRYMLMTAALGMYPPGLVVPANKLLGNAVGDVFVQDLSPIDIAVRLEQVANSWDAELVLENRSPLQGTLIHTQFTSNVPLLILGTSSASCLPFGGGTLPLTCTISVVPGNQETRVLLIIEAGNLATANLQVSIDVNEVDTNLANNTAQITLVDPTPAPPPPPPGGGGGGGGGGAPGWGDLLALILLLAFQRISSSRLLHSNHRR